MDNPLVQADPGLFIWTILTFLVLMALLTIFAWRPLLQALESRQEAIRKSLDDADKAKRELERLQGESAQIIRNAHAEAATIASKSWADTEKLREETKQKAKAEGDAIIKEARRQIQMESERVLRELRKEVADLSVLVASKFIQKNFSKEDSDRLIEEALKELETRQQ